MVDDVNDNDPVFNQSTYLGHVMENSNVSTSVATVYATDKDQDANGRVSYKITSGNTGEAFEINNQSGVVTVKGSIDREKIKEYSLIIQAEDAGHPSSRKVRFVLQKFFERHIGTTHKNRKIKWYRSCEPESSIFPFVFTTSFKD